MEVLCAGEGLADEMRSDDVAVASDEFASGLFGEEDVGYGGDRERVADAEKYGSDEGVEHGGKHHVFHGVVLGGRWH